MSVEGFLFVDKPAGLTSHDVVARVRRAARSRRVGHAGTLDPFATGLLVIAVGEHTRLLPFVQGEPKVYDTTIRFGFETDTDDCTGERTIVGAVPDSADSDELTRCLQQLTGSQWQTPPAFSAKHVGGQRAYALARRGQAVTVPPAQVHVHAWTNVSRNGERLTATITCGTGTYIRALARDLGRALDSAAHADSLRRVQCGAATLTEAVSVDALLPGSIADGHVLLRSPLELFEDITSVTIDRDEVRALSFGRAIYAAGTGSSAALLHAGEVMAIASRHEERWQPHTVLHGTVTRALSASQYPSSDITGSHADES